MVARDHTSWRDRPGVSYWKNLTCTALQLLAGDGSKLPVRPWDCKDKERMFQKKAGIKLSLQKRNKIYTNRNEGDVLGGRRRLTKGTGVRRERVLVVFTGRRRLGETWPVLEQEGQTPGGITCALECEVHRHLSDLYTFSEIPSPHKPLIQPTCMEPFLCARHCAKCSGWNRDQDKANHPAFG